MTKISPLNNIENELIIGLAGGLGADFDEVAAKLGENLAKAGYHIEIIRIAADFQHPQQDSGFAQCYGTKQRQIHGNSYWAKRVIEQIFKLRSMLSAKYKKIAYIVRSLKNKDELELLSNVYGKNFSVVSIFSENESSMKLLNKKLKLGRLSIDYAQKQMHKINAELQFGPDLDIGDIEEVFLDDSYKTDKYSEQDQILKFLIRKDQVETHPELGPYGQNLFKCYSIANYFVYQNKNLDRQLTRFVNVLFNDPFAEPTNEEFYMFCAQAEAYRSLDLDRQVGAVIVNSENELVASGFNDVNKVGGGHFEHHDHPMQPEEATQLDHRDFTQQHDFNHTYLDQIARNIARKLGLGGKDELTLRDQITGITEFKRSTHAEMSAILDAARRGVSVKDCTIYVNFYPCHNCAKHIIASGIRKIVFIHPYTKSKAREMYSGMIKHGLFAKEDAKSDVVIFEPFLGVSPNRFMLAFANDKDGRLERENGRENGKIQHWEINHSSIPRNLIGRQPHSYISSEWAVIHNKIPDISGFYKEPSAF